MSKSSAKHQVRSTSSKDRFILSLIKLMIAVVINIPLYALLTAPWFILMFIVVPEGSGIQILVLKSMSFLAGKPYEGSLSDGDIARATVIILLAFEVVYETVRRIRGRTTERDNELADKRSQRMQMAVGTVGWAIASIALGVEALGFFAVVVFVTGSGSLWLYITIREAFRKFLKIFEQAL